MEITIVIKVNVGESRHHLFPHGTNDFRPPDTGNDPDEGSASGQGPCALARERPYAARSTGRLQRVT